MTSCSAGRYKVTKAALALVGLIRSSLQEACEAGTPAAVQSGCNAVLDMASLLIAVPQGVHGEQLQVSTHEQSMVGAMQADVQQQRAEGQSQRPLCVAGALPHSVKSSCRSPPVVTAVISQRGAAAGQQRCLQRPVSLIIMHRGDMVVVMP